MYRKSTVARFCALHNASNQRFLGTLVEKDKKFMDKSCKYNVSPSFKRADLTIQRAPEADLKPKPDWSKCVLKFGRQFTDHMLQVQWSMVNGGWGKPGIGPFQNININPAAPALHYAVEVFEGLKAHMGTDGRIRLFRPELHLARMLSSCRRVCLPEFDAHELLECIVELIRVDRAWVPNNNNVVPGCSLYIRPTVINTEATLDPGRAQEALLFVIAGPVGSYFSSGFKPVSLYADPQLVRSWPGGAGAYKIGSNYAPTLLLAVLAKEEYGCHQILWLFGPDHSLTEVGTMNIFVYWRNEKGENVLVTPPVDSDELILPGVTRATVLELAREWGEFKVEEKQIKMDEIINALNENRVMEMFGTGTACVVCPICKILYRRNGKIEEYCIPTKVDRGQPIVSEKFHGYITGVQKGEIQRPEWIKEI